MKQKFNMWIHKNMEGCFEAGKIWLSEYNLAGQKCFENAVSLGPVEFEIEVPEIDTRAAAIESLTAAIQKERADSQAKINLLLERISNLQAIGHDQPEVREWQEGDVF